jgi:hypothetical protein
VERNTRWPPEAWLPLLAGLVWLWNAPGHGLLAFLLAVLPGCLLLGSGVTMLLMPGDARTSQYAAAGGVFGAVLALPALLAVGFFQGLLLLGVSAASFFAAGYHSLRIEPPAEGVPLPELSPSLAAQVACDEAILSTMSIGTRIPTSDDLRRTRAEIEQARARFEAAGGLEKPADYHQPPPPLLDPDVRAERVRGIAYEHVSAASGYAPREGEPGRERWLSYRANATAHAWVVRSSSERPWLVCIHGYQMGTPLIDVSAFDPRWLRDELGLNLLMPVLPLHGPRRVGRRSGDRFLGGDVLDTIHAEAQAMWDIRRWLGWIREQGAPAVGVFGLSLGGYNASLLACLDDDLACVVAGIPATDFSRLFTRHSPPLQLLEAALNGLEEHHMSEIMRVVSPLALEPQVPRDRRTIFAGVADRLVPPDQVYDLWRHWEEPRIEWYQGAHLTFPRHPGVRRTIREALRESGLAA